MGGSLQSKFSGKEVHVNPTDEATYLRQTGRAARLKSSLEKMEKRGQQDTARYERTKLEHEMCRAYAKYFELKKQLKEMD